jgi:hypothetical protein
MSVEEQPLSLSAKEIQQRLIRACQYRMRQLVTEDYALTMRDRRGIEALIAEYLRELLDKEWGR